MALPRCKKTIGRIAYPAISETIPLYGTLLFDQPRTSESVDGPLPVVRNGYIEDFVSDADGNIYFPDSGSHSIRKISNQGIASTISSEQLLNVDFVGFNDQGELHLLQIVDLFRPDTRWQLKRLQEDGTALLLAEGAGNVTTHLTSS